MIHCEAMKKITTWTYLKLLASPVSFVARNLYSVELAVHGPNIPWLYRFCAGKWQRFFLKEKEKRKKKEKQPQHAMNYFDQSATIAETVSNALETTVCLLREMRKIIPIPHHCDI